MAEHNSSSDGFFLLLMFVGLIIAALVLAYLYFALFPIAYDALLWRWEAIPALMSRPGDTIAWAHGVVSKVGYNPPIKGVIIGAGVLEAVLIVGVFFILGRLGLFKDKARYSERRLRGALVLDDMAFGAAALISHHSAKTMSFRQVVRLAKKPWPKIVAAAHEQGMVRVGGLPMPRKVETEHTLITGSSGSGKSFLIAQTLHDLAKRGDRVICFDHGGAFRRQFSKVDAVSLSPAEEGSPGWDLRNEVPRHTIGNCSPPPSFRRALGRAPIGATSPAICSPISGTMSGRNPPMPNCCACAPLPTATSSQSLSKARLRPLTAPMTTRRSWPR
jgi:hypothetical protein